RLMEAGLPAPFALGREYLESGAEAESELALALCDSPSAAVREFGREFITARRERLLSADLLQKLTQHPDAAVQAWLAELLRAQEFAVDTANFDATVLRSRGRARRAKEDVKKRLDEPQSILVDTATLLEMARG